MESGYDSGTAREGADMTYILVLCLVCGVGSIPIQVPRGDLAACEADAQRFRAHTGTIAECVRQSTAQDDGLADYCRMVTTWKPPAHVAAQYADLPRTMAECMTRYSPKTATE